MRGQLARTIALALAAGLYIKSSIPTNSHHHRRAAEIRASDPRRPIWDFGIRKIGIQVPRLPTRKLR